MTARNAAERAAHARWQARRRRLIGYGQWEPFMDAEPVRQHLRKLMAGGMPLQRTAELTGTGFDALNSILYGSSGHPPSRKTGTQTGRAVLAFEPTLDDYPPLSVIAVTGSLRRLRALAVLGWTANGLAQLAGCHVARFRRLSEKSTVSAATARLMRDVYDQVWDRPPSADEVPPAIAERTRRRAVAEGWPSPLAWDDDTIDDPRARPDLGRKRIVGEVDEAAVIRALAGEHVGLSGRARFAAVERGMRHGMELQAVADVLGMDPDTVKRYWERAKARARARGEKWPDQRAWSIAA